MKPKKKTEKEVVEVVAEYEEKESRALGPLRNGSIRCLYQGHNKGASYTSETVKPAFDFVRGLTDAEDTSG